jgi:hypothetical protein
VAAERAPEPSSGAVPARVAAEEDAELADHRPITLDLTRLGHATSVGAGLLLEVADLG